MLFGDPDIEGTVREFLAEQVETSARWHGSGHGDDLVVLFRFLDQALGEDLGIGRCRRF